MNAKGVPVDQDITLTFSEAVNPSTANATTIVVMPMAPDQEHEEGSEADMQRIAGTYSTSGSTVTFRTTTHYERGQDYAVSVRNVKATSGTTFSSAMISFRTRENPRTQELRYQNTGALRDTTTWVYNGAGLRTKETRTNSIGALVRTIDWEYDSAGNETKETERDGLNNITEISQMSTPLVPVTLPAAPSILTRYIDFNASNVITSYGTNYQEGGTTVARLSFNGAGADTLWNFVDDILSSASTPAKKFGNAYVTSRYQPATTPSTATWNTTTKFTNPALVLRNVSANVVDNMERTIYEATYSNLGPDGVIDLDGSGNPRPLSGNDVLRTYSKREYDPGTGRRLRTYNYSATNGGPGIDGIWFTQDDVVTGLTVREYDTMGMLTRSTTYSGKGIDGIWELTADNDVAAYTIYDYSGMNRSRARDYIAGADLRVGGIDDILTEDTTYDTSR